MHCSQCGFQVTMEKLRLRDKMKQKYICNVCECKLTQLRRENGAWPTPEFTMLSEEEQKAFYTAARTCDSAKALKTLLDQYVKKI